MLNYNYTNFFYYIVCVVTWLVYDLFFFTSRPLSQGLKFEPHRTVHGGRSSGQHARGVSFICFRLSFVHRTCAL